MHHNAGEYGMIRSLIHKDEKKHRDFCTTFQIHTFSPEDKVLAVEKVLEKKIWNLSRYQYQIQIQMSCIANPYKKICVLTKKTK